MALGHLWAGKVYGTNTGNLFVEFQGEDAALTGVLRHNDPDVGLIAYRLTGSFDGTQLTLVGEPLEEVEGIAMGRLEATAAIDGRGYLAGRWETDIGSAGTFELFPHDRPDIDPNLPPEQLHTARHNFNAVQVDFDQVIELADRMQSDFQQGRLVVTVVSGTERARFLPAFRADPQTDSNPTVIRLHVQEPDGKGLQRVAQVEFGPQINSAMAQGGDEAWVLGMLEKLKRYVNRYERSYATNIKRLGFGVNQVLILGAIVFLPSLQGTWQRAVLMVGVLLLGRAVNGLHNRYLPFADIRLVEKPEGLIAKIGPTALSWVIALTAGAGAVALGALLQGWLEIP